MKQSLVKIIKEYFKRHPDRFVNGGELERLAFENGFKASNCSRRLRELENDGFLLKEIRRIPPSKTATVWYKYKICDTRELREKHGNPQENISAREININALRAFVQPNLGL